MKHIGTIEHIVLKILVYVFYCGYVFYCNFYLITLIFIFTSFNGRSPGAFSTEAILSNSPKKVITTTFFSTASSVAS